MKHTDLKKVYEEIRIRNVDAAAIAKIDQQAKMRNMTRNTYLKKYIESLAIISELKEMEDTYSHLVNAVTEAIEHNSNEIKELKDILLQK